jgi:hypothetical protein
MVATASGVTDLPSAVSKGADVALPGDRRSKPLTTGSRARTGRPARAGARTSPVVTNVLNG